MESKAQVFASALKNPIVKVEPKTFPFTTNKVKHYTDQGMKVINQFEVLQEIGRGAFGKVHLAVHQKTGAKAALKKASKFKLKRVRLLEQDRDGNHVRITGIDKAQREMSILDSVHQNKSIPTIFSVVETNTKLYIFQELGERMSLMEWNSRKEAFEYKALLEETRESHLPEDVMRAVMRELLLVVKDLHAQGIVHRDIKPSNIFMRADGSVLLGDFGEAYRCDGADDGWVPSTCGTYYFWPPEMCRPGPYNAFEADVWACGVTLYAMATKRLPWYNAATQAFFNEVNSTRAPVPKGVSKELAALLSSMLTHDPKLRPSIDAILTHEWMQ